MNSAQAHEMRFGVLGPVEVLKDGAPLDLGPRQRRLLLLRLLVEDGRPVSQDTLLRDLWPTDRPTGAASSVRAHVSRLRAVLDPVRQGRSTMLVSGPAGYALKVPREARDTALFEDSVGRAREALRGRQLPLARQEIETALGRWRGEPLAEATEHAFAIRERSRLDGALQDAKELHAAILVQQGETEPAIDVAEGLVLKAPLRETSWALLMRALYAAGRPVEALKQYERFRDMLATELGLDPSPQLRDLHTAVLRHDIVVLGTGLGPSGAAPAGAPLSPGPDFTAACPHPEPGSAAAPFVGRRAEMAQLGGLLAAAAGGRPGWAVVRGDQGSGKTRLLEELCAQAAAAGFTVARTRAGQALSGNRGISQTCPTVQLLDALRQDGKDSAEDEVARKDPLGTVVHELTQAPTLCVVDDLDQAPQGFHRLLRRLAKILREATVAFVCTLRGDAGNPATSKLLAELAPLGATWLTLEPLATEDVAELLAAAGEETPAEEAAALHRRAEGQPFALAELLKLPADRRTGPEAQVPAAVRNILHARLVELPDPARTMLTYAAADGEWLDVGLLAAVQDLAADELLPLIDAAVTARILVWDATAGGTGRYRLPELPRDVVRDTQTPSSRQLRHAALARELATRTDAGTDLDPGTDTERARLARHLRAAGPMAPAAAPAAHSTHPRSTT
ncbi:BTAD domain-containing putative transcriptional regulator [Streptomyces sp. CA-249302]|uniref:BTAD domain-containing putative transcriptional regulator n=1 Tax=Streptomyces sp. CA-249302 TaxID=3240058 RepID=UPI003D8B3834